LLTRAWDSVGPSCLLGSGTQLIPLLTGSWDSVDSDCWLGPGTQWFAIVD